MLRTASSLLERRKKVTAEELAASEDLTGKTVVVTGGNSGLGKETVRALASAGARVIATSRDAAGGQQLAAELSNNTLKGKVLVAQLDLTDLTAVAAFAQQLGQEPRIDVLILNAGVMGVPLGYTKHGFETHLATNHFGHFYLFQLLESKLAAQKVETRVVVVACGKHSQVDHWKGVDFTDMHFKDGRSYDKMHAFGQSKTANVLFAKQIATRHPEGNLKAYAVDPGFAKTGLQRHITVGDRLMVRMATHVGRHKPIPQAAATIVYAAVDPELSANSGAYLANASISKPAKHCLDANSADRLWTESSAQIKAALDRVGRTSISQASSDAGSARISSNGPMGGNSGQ